MVEKMNINTEMHLKAMNAKTPNLCFCSID